MNIKDLQPGSYKVISGQIPTQAPAQPSALQNVGNVAYDTAMGIGKGGLSTLQGLGTIGQVILNQTAGRAVNAIEGKGFTPTTDQFSISSHGRSAAEVKKLLEPKNTAEAVGKGLEQAAEYFIPAAKAAKAERLVTTLSQGISNGLLAAGTRIAGKAAVQGLATAGVNLAQTGGDAKQALKTGAIAGGISGGLSAVGETARALRLPERLYQTVFKNAKGDMLKEFNSDYLVNLNRTNPEKYKELVDAGIVKTAVGGVPKLNETLAEQALNRGLKGSINNMANEAVGKTFENEQKLQALAKAYKGTVDFSESNFQKVLRGIAQDFDGVGLNNELSTKATALADVLKTTKGKVDAKTALEIRRLLDGARISRSFNTPASRLSADQTNLKTLADVARKRVNDIPGFAPVMKEYSFYIQALEQLAKEGARRGNTQIISLMDSIFLGGGIASGAAIPAGILGGARKILQSGRGATSVGSAINTGLGAKTVGTIGATSNLLGGVGQEQPIQ